MYSFKFSEKFDKNLEKIARRDIRIGKRVKKALKLLSHDPKHNSLKTHQVNARFFGLVWSSWVSGDVRIIWSYSQGKINVINILNIGGHSGKKRVYDKSC